MAPKSWKPDFSLADAVDPEAMEQEEAEEDRASSVMAYHAYRYVKGCCFKVKGQKSFQREQCL